MMMGGDEPQKQVIIDKVKLEQNGISIDDVVQVFKGTKSQYERRLRR